MTERNKERLELIKQEKRNLYLLVAVKVFQEKGYHATTIKDMTDAAGTSVGNFYQYFENKEQIFQVLVEQLHQSLIGKLRQLSKYEIPPLPVAKQVFKEVISSLKEQKAIALIYIEEMGGISKEYQQLRNRLQEDYYAELERIFSHGFELLKIKDLNPRICAIGWITVFLQSFYWWTTTNFAMDIDNFTNYVLNLLLFGTISSSRKYPA